MYKNSSNLTRFHEMTLHLKPGFAARGISLIIRWTLPFHIVSPGSMGTT